MNKARSQRGDCRRMWRMCSRAQVWLIVLIATFLVAVPTIRTSESSEPGTTKERVEEASLLIRSVNLKQSSHRSHRELIVFAVSFRSPPGRHQQSLPTPLPGHRLPNGLMAPMTC